MLKSKFVAAALAAMLVFTSANVSVGQERGPTPVPGSSAGSPIAVWLIFGCASGIILAAAVANARDNRQLTMKEAITCGLLFWFNPQQRRRP
jgi:hypothetical protein